MARTIRRKTMTREYPSILARDVYDYRRRGIWESVEARSPEGRRRIALFHSDVGTGRHMGQTAPRWFRHLRNRRVARMEQRELIRWQRRVDYEIPKAVRVNDATWYFW